MLASGNGDAKQCAANLLKIIRGENPFERVKGIAATITDACSGAAQYEGIAETEWVIDTYEPRVEVRDIDLSATDAQKGDFSIMTRIKIRGGKNEWNQ